MSEKCIFTSSSAVRAKNRRKSVSATDKLEVIKRIVKVIYKNDQQDAIV